MDNDISLLREVAASGAIKPRLCHRVEVLRTVAQNILRRDHDETTLD
jgi:hypothetical protein